LCISRAILHNYNKNILPEVFTSQGRGGICRPATVPPATAEFLGIPLSSFAPSLTTPASATVAAVLGLSEGGANGEGTLLPACAPPRSQGFGGAGRPAFNSSTPTSDMHFRNHQKCLSLYSSNIPYASQSCYLTQDIFSYPAWLDIRP
jgi:hypothetical protein